ncbi:MAG: hypothetical protein GX278_03445 [Aeromonadales bacterium]|nr:hypothetical protein [Aeromonadales bacterium]
MNKLKLAFNEFYKTLLNYILKKDENSKIKYKNLLVVISVLLALFIALIVAFSSSGNSNSNNMQLNPKDTSDSKEVSFEDNNAVATDPQTLDLNSVSVNPNDLDDDSPIKPDSEELQEAQLIAPQEPATETQANQSQHSGVEPEVPSNQTETPDSAANNNYHYSLFCDKFASKEKAEATKANIAISSGQISNVVYKNNSYQLQIEPFTTRDEAIGAFNKLDSLALVNQCTLETRK